MQAPTRLLRLGGIYSLSPNKATVWAGIVQDLQTRGHLNNVEDFLQAADRGEVGRERPALLLSDIPFNGRFDLCLFASLNNENPPQSTSLSFFARPVAPTSYNNFRSLRTQPEWNKNPQYAMSISWSCPERLVFQIRYPWTIDGRAVCLPHDEAELFRIERWTALKDWSIKLTQPEFLNRVLAEVRVWCSHKYMLTRPR
jgi:hypothetical protein